VIIWDLVTGKPAQTLTGHADAVSSVAWSADGRLASGSGDDGTVIIWNLATGKPAQTITGYTDYVNSVAWSADGRLASGSGALDKAVIIWDLEMGKPSQKIKGHAGSITSVAWSPDGRLASGSRDKTIRIARTDVLFHNPCNWVFRNMTLSEWVSTQGIFFVYQPACPNLPTPSWTEAQTLTELLITWQGRVIFLLAGIVLIAIVGGLLWASYKLALRLRGKKDAGLKKILSIVGLGCSVILLLAFLAAIVIVAIALVQAG
jgi:hypothetical protein